MQAPRLLARLAEDGAPGAPPEGALGGASESAPVAREVVEVAVKDTGPGMAPEIQKQIFDPFFTTKARGTGLGLAIVHNIVESHHGLIDVETGGGEGTTFLVMFPLAAG